MFRIVSFILLAFGLVLPSWAETIQHCNAKLTIAYNFDHEHIPPSYDEFVDTIDFKTFGRRGGPDTAANRQTARSRARESAQSCVNSWFSDPEERATSIHECIRTDITDDHEFYSAATEGFAAMVNDDWGLHSLNSTSASELCAIPYLSEFASGYPDNEIRVSADLEVTGTGRCDLVGDWSRSLGDFNTFCIAHGGPHWSDDDGDTIPYHKDQCLNDPQNGCSPCPIGQVWTGHNSDESPVCEGTNYEAHAERLGKIIGKLCPLGQLDCVIGGNFNQYIELESLEEKHIKHNWTVWISVWKNIPAFGVSPRCMPNPSSGLTENQACYLDSGTPNPDTLFPEGHDRSSGIDITHDVAPDAEDGKIRKHLIQAEGSVWIGSEPDIQDSFGEATIDTGCVHFVSDAHPDGSQHPDCEASILDADGEVHMLRETQSWVRAWPFIQDCYNGNAEHNHEAIDCGHMFFSARQYTSLAPIVRISWNDADFLDGAYIAQQCTRSINDAFLYDASIDVDTVVATYADHFEYKCSLNSDLLDFVGHEATSNRDLERLALEQVGYNFIQLAETSLVMMPLGWLAASVKAAAAAEDATLTALRIYNAAFYVGKLNQAGFALYNVVSLAEGLEAFAQCSTPDCRIVAMGGALTSAYFLSSDVRSFRHIFGEYAEFAKINEAFGVTEVTKADPSEIEGLLNIVGDSARDAVEETYFASNPTPEMHPDVLVGCMRNCISGLPHQGEHLTLADDPPQGDQRAAPRRPRFAPQNPAEQRGEINQMVGGPTQADWQELDNFLIRSAIEDTEHLDQHEGNARLVVAHATMVDDYSQFLATFIVPENWVVITYSIPGERILQSNVRFMEDGSYTELGGNRVIARPGAVLNDKYLTPVRQNDVNEIVQEGTITVSHGLLLSEIVHPDNLLNVPTSGGGSIRVVELGICSVCESHPISTLFRDVFNGEMDTQLFLNRINARSFKVTETIEHLRGHLSRLQSRHPLGVFLYTDNLKISRIIGFMFAENALIQNQQDELSRLNNDGQYSFYINNPAWHHYRVRLGQLRAVAREYKDMFPTNIHGVPGTWYYDDWVPPLDGAN